ncbi:MAG TPA: DNA polymerase III subunit alpha, partial [Candidatus Paceibacterota bacterium]|nr:DNA polymerase III subunit alpha [Candidatus Paceibacterota bacterium]
LICTGTQTTLEDSKRMRYAPEQYHLRSAEEMKALFAEIPEAVFNTLEVAEKCDLKIEFNRLHYPNFEPPAAYDRLGYLRHLLVEGLERRYGIWARSTEEGIMAERVVDARILPTYQALSGGGEGVKADAGNSSDLENPAVSAAVQGILDRLGMELKVIEKTGFVSYFLIVGDFVRYGRSVGVSCVARGSAAGSLVTFLLEISNVDPIRYGLLFERFLNPERVNPPDIDIDFADDRRGDVIEYVRQKYGRESVAQIVTFGTMGAKSVVRDVGRVMGLAYGDCDRLAKMIPNELKMDLTKALQQSPDLKKAYDTEEITHELIDTAFVLEDLTRNASVHAAGVVIGDQPLIHLLPLKQDEDGAIVTQYAMGPVGDLGLLKMDFLGLKTLTVIRNTCELVKAVRGIDVPIHQLPLDDAKTYDLLNKGLTVGVFQLESGGMRDLCRKFQISSIEHITALVALYRPGPMDLIPDFIKRRHGEVRIEYEHPLLERICRETYGIMVYQEQVMQAAQVLAGYTLGGADLLRRAMGKKKVEEMQKQRAQFVQGCAEKNQIPAAQANEIFDLLEKFAGYGFNKSHAAAYAIVAYQTAYLKANYPVEFLSAMMTNDMGDTDKVSILIQEARAFDVDVLPPDINESEAGFAPAPDRRAIRFGLAAIKGVGMVAVESIREARRQGGRFQSLDDLCERVETRTVNRKVLEALIKSGACDAFQVTRASLYAQIDRALARAARTVQDKLSGQGSFFGLFESKEPLQKDHLIALPEWPQSERLAAEKELLGFYVTGHPVMPFLPLIERYALKKTSELSSLPNRSMTRIGGLITAVQVGVSKKNGKSYLMATLEDLEGTVSVLCFQENFEKMKAVLTPGQAVLITAEVNSGEDKPKLFPQEAVLLEEAPARYTRQVHFRLRLADVTEADLDEARNIALAHPGKCPLFLCLIRPDGITVFIETNEKYAVQPSISLQQALEERFGANSYYPKVDMSLPEKAPRKWPRKTPGQNGES